MIQSDDASRQIAWTTEKEIVLAKGWVTIFENIKHGNVMKEHRFWCEESGASDEDYINRAMIHYQVKTGNTFKYRHCWEVLKDSPKWKEQELPKFATESEGVARDINEVQEIQRTMGRDKARAARKNKGSKASRLLGS
ncbi:hypothetical protein Tco_0478927 [Tanacetum coccineum]